MASSFNVLTRLILAKTLMSILVAMVSGHEDFFYMGRSEELEAAALAESEGSGYDPSIDCSLDSPQWMEDDALDSMSDYCQDVS